MHGETVKKKCVSKVSMGGCVSSFHGLCHFSFHLECFKVTDAHNVHTTTCCLMYSVIIAML